MFYAWFNFGFDSHPVWSYNFLSGDDIMLAFRLQMFWLGQSTTFDKLHICLSSIFLVIGSILMQVCLVLPVVSVRWYPLKQQHFFFFSPHVLISLCKFHKWRHETRYEINSHSELMLTFIYFLTSYFTNRTTSFMLVFHHIWVEKPEPGLIHLHFISS